GFHNAQPLETILKIFPHLAVIGFMLKHARRLAAFFKFHIFMTFIVLEGAGWKFNFLGASLHGTSLTGQVCPISVVLEDGQAFQGESVARKRSFCGWRRGSPSRWSLRTGWK